MSFFDSHLHFDSFHADGTLDSLLADAEAAGVRQMVAIGGSAAANDLALTLARQHPDQIYATLGYDRDETGRSLDMDAVRTHLSDPGVVGVGETGLDYHYNPESVAEQCALFQSMLDLAAEACLPVVVHSRDAEDDTLQLLGEHAQRWRGDADRMAILHCFTGDLPFAKRLLDLGCYISFSGILTFKNAEGLREAARYVPEESLLIETDAPYLAPVPFRGKTNQPAYVVEVARMIANIRGLTLERVAELTFVNAQRCFGCLEI